MMPKEESPSVAKPSLRLQRRKRAAPRTTALQQKARQGENPLLHRFARQGHTRSPSPARNANAPERERSPSDRRGSNSSSTKKPPSKRRNPGVTLTIQSPCDDDDDDDHLPANTVPGIMRWGSPNGALNARLRARLPSPRVSSSKGLAPFLPPRRRGNEGPGQLGGSP